MPIYLVLRLGENESAFAPEIYCDGCGGRIYDVKEALVGWQNVPENPASTAGLVEALGKGEPLQVVRKFYFAHRRDCDQELEARYKFGTLWMGLEDFIAALPKAVC